MRPVHHLLLLAPALIGVAAADLPRKAPLTKYTPLWTDSPFTSKPPPPEAGPVASPLDEYALSGVAPIKGGYQVTIINRKNPEERITLQSGQTVKGFKIIGVDRKPGIRRGTTVRMSSGSSTGTVAFDESLLALQPPPAQPQLPPGVQPPGQPQQPGQPPIRQPRPRVVPPPVPQGQQVPAGQPPIPQVQPQPQSPALQPGQRPTSNRSRPSRR